MITVDSSSPTSVSNPTVAPPTPTPRLSVVAPCRNEVENLRDFLEELHAALTAAASTIGEFEVIVVDDGSTDGSLQMLLDLRNVYPRLRVLSLDAAHGKTSALDAGFRAARGAIVATIDADLQDDPADIPRLMAALSDYDAVNGRRSVRRDNGLRRLSSRVANWIRNRLSGETIADSASGLKVYRRECLAGLKLYHGLHRFMPTLVKLEGFRVGELPINNRPRTRGVAKYGFWNRVFAAGYDLLAVRWMKARQLRHRVREL